MLKFHESRPVRLPHSEVTFPGKRMDVSVISWLGWFQLVSLASICAVAAFSTVMRPPRWADRKPAQF